MERNIKWYATRISEGVVITTGLLVLLVIWDILETLLV